MENEATSLIATDFDLALRVMKASGRLEELVTRQQKGEFMIPTTEPTDVEYFLQVFNVANLVLGCTNLIFLR